MSDTHVDLFTLEIDNGVLATVFEKVLVGRNAVVGQDLGETISAPCVHQIGEELQNVNHNVKLIRTKEQ